MQFVVNIFNSQLFSCDLLALILSSSPTDERKDDVSKPSTPSAKVFERGRSYGTLPGHGNRAPLLPSDSTERENCSDTEAPPLMHEVNTQL